MWLLPMFATKSAMYSLSIELNYDLEYICETCSLRDFYKLVSLWLTKGAMAQASFSTSTKQAQESIELFRYLLRD